MPLQATNSLILMMLVVGEIYVPAFDACADPKALGLSRRSRPVTRRLERMGRLGFSRFASFLTCGRNVYFSLIVYKNAS
jgi:hypothetical protein